MATEAWRRVDEANYCYCCFGTVIVGWRSGHSFSCDMCRSHYGQQWLYRGCKARLHEYARERQLCGAIIPRKGMVRCGLVPERHELNEASRCGPEWPHAWEVWPEGGT